MTSPARLEFPDGFLWGASTSAYQIEGSVQGRGRLAGEGADHYDRLIDALLDRGIKPLVTLYHWDLPQALQDRGGWRNRETAEAFGEYAALCFERFGDRVPYWITHNEPWIVVVLGHELGIHAPGERDLAGSVRAAHHLLLSHGRAVQALAAAGRDASVGVAYSLFPHYPASASYPADMAARYEQASGPADFIAGGDLAAIGARCDFVGVNYYTRRRVAADPVHAEYGGPPLIITENGAVFYDQPGPDGRVHDRRRVSFLHDHLAAVHAAIERGANVLGYFHWSLMDNFEWACGYGQRFGLVHVDYETQQRTVKDSGAYLARVAADNALDVPLTWRAAR